jgi:hypothetical protein
VLSALLCVLAGAALLLGEPGEQSPRSKLGKEHLIRALDCVLHKLPGVALSATYSGGKELRLRYRYGRAEIGPDTYLEDSLAVIGYARSDKNGVFYEMSVEKGEECDEFIVHNSGTLRKHKGGWYVRESGGGIYTRDRVQRLVEVVSRTEEVRIPISKLITTCAKCQFGSLY